MSSLARHLHARQNGSPAVIPYLTVGAPDPDAWRAAAEQLAGAGSVAMEFGVPTRAHGEHGALARAHDRALASTSRSLVFALVREFCAADSCPVVLVAAWADLGGEEALAGLVATAAEAGCGATLILGLPTLCIAPYAAASRACGLETVLTVGPEHPARLRRAVYRAATGAVYVRANRGNDRESIGAIARESPVPVIAGGGVAGAAAVRAVCRAGARAAAIGEPVALRMEQGLPLGTWLREMSAS